MNNLFKKVPEFEKQASGLFMDRDSTKWVRQIITNFIQKFPFAESLPMTIAWTKKDDGRGYAVGALQAGNASVPLIVREWRLAPLDTMIVNENALPLTAEVLAALMTKTQPFKGIAQNSRKGTESMFGGMSVSPTGHQTVDASAGMTRPAKTASFIDNLVSVDRKIVIDLLEKVSNDKTLQQGFIKNETTDILEKLAKKSTGVEEDRGAFLRGLEVERQMVGKSENGEYYVKQACAGVDHTWQERIPSTDIDKFPTLAAENSTNLEKTAEVPTQFIKMAKDNSFLAISTENKDWYITENDLSLEKVAEVSTKLSDITSDLPEVGKFGCWVTEDGATDPFEIIGITKVANQIPLNVYKTPDNTYLCVNEDRAWFTFDKEPVKTAQIIKIAETRPEFGDTGVFVLGHSATKPVQVGALESDVEKNTVKFAAWDGIKHFSVYLTNMDVDRIETVGSDIYLPKTASFIKLNEKLTKYNDREQTALAKNAHIPNKIAFLATDGFNQIKFLIGAGKHAHLDKNTCEIPESTPFLELGVEKQAEHLVIPCGENKIDRDNYGYYSLSGPEFNKYAEQGHTIRDLNYYDAKWAMIMCNSTIESCEKLASLKNNKRLLINNLNASIPVQVCMNKIAEEYNTDIEPLLVNMQPTLLKCAASLSDRATVDAVLSLGVLSRKNVAEYVSMLPSYEAVMSDLASLLIMSRLGMKQVPEEAIKEAMEALTTIVLLLQRLNTVVS